MACGVSLELTNLETFYDALQKSAKNLAGDRALKTELTIDVTLSLIKLQLSFTS